MPPGKDGSEELLDHLVLTDNDLLQFLLHEQAVLGKLLQDIIERFGLGGSRHAGGFPSSMGQRAVHRLAALPPSTSVSALEGLWGKRGSCRPGCVGFGLPRVESFCWGTELPSSSYNLSPQLPVFHCSHDLTQPFATSPG